jgi:hypothetical protein
MERWEVTDARYAGDFRVWIQFADGLEGEVNFAKRLPNGVFKPLHDVRRFRRVRFDPLSGTISWPGDLDWAPESLYGIVRRSSAARKRASQRKGGARAGSVAEISRRGTTVLPVPSISTFYGFVIQMFYADHVRPHFHARHGGGKVSVDIATGAITGKLGASGRKILRAWASEHRDELTENWERARRHQKLKRIAPYAR